MDLHCRYIYSSCSIYSDIAHCNQDEAVRLCMYGECQNIAFARIVIYNTPVRSKSASVSPERKSDPTSYRTVFFLSPPATPTKFPYFNVFMVAAKCPDAGDTVSIIAEELPLALSPRK